MDEPVDHGGSDDLVAEDVAPGGEGLVACDDQARPLIAGADEVEHQVGGLGVEGDVADLVDDQQRRPEQPAQLLVEASLLLAVAEPGDHSVAVANATRWPARQARIPSAIARCVLPRTLRPEQDDVVFGGEKVELAEVEDERLLDGALEAEVEVLQSLADGGSAEA